jgi:hypothetical protein
VEGEEGLNRDECSVLVINGSELSSDESLTVLFSVAASSTNALDVNELDIKEDRLHFFVEFLLEQEVVFSFDTITDDAPRVKEGEMEETMVVGMTEVEVRDVELVRLEEVKDVELVGLKETKDMQLVGPVEVGEIGMVVEGKLGER